MDRNELEKSRLKQRKRRKSVGRKKLIPLTKRPKRIGEMGDRKKFKRKPRVQESVKPVFGDVTQGFKDTIQSVIDEGGSPKLTTTEAIVDRSIDKLNKPKLALRGGGRAYGRNS
jgi:hypothetical protein